MHLPQLSLLKQSLKLIVFCGLAAVASAQAQEAEPHRDVYMYQQPDRDTRLVEKARAEGELLLYTTLPASRTSTIAEAFEKKYGIKVTVWRANNEKLVLRVISEAQGNRNLFDVIDTNGPAVESLAREKLVSAFYSPYMADLPEFAVPPHHRWVSARMNVYVPAYNTNQVSKEEIPDNYEGFLDPKWKGRLGIESTDSPWMAAFVRIRGEEKGMDFFRKLSDMDLDVRSGHILLTELVAAGEVPVALTVYNSTVETLKKKGAPIEWVALDPVIARPQGLGLAAKAPHPHAALLFADFLLSPEGQRLLGTVGVIPTSLKVKNVLNDFKYEMMDPEAELDAGEKWDKLWEDFIIKKR